MILHEIRGRLLDSAVPSKVRFYKIGPGDYAEGDQFIGVTVPILRKIALEFRNLPWDAMETLLASPFNEERLLALIILVKRYALSSDQEFVYQFYRRNLKSVNNWNLVDASAHLIMGAHLMYRDKSILLELAQSENLWERRIAIVATWFFIRNGDYEWTLIVAKILRSDSHDLIHKSVGWMLREMGKKNGDLLREFLDHHAHQMPRTMLRYAIEKFSLEQRREYTHRIKVV